MVEIPTKHLIHVTVPAFGCKLVFDYLSSLAITHGVRPYNDKETRLPGSKVVYTFKSDERRQVESFAQTIDKIFNKSFIQYVFNTEPAFENLWDYYEHLLKTFDKHYEMSDDHRVWSAGEKHRKIMDAVFNELNKIDADRVVLYHKIYVER